MSSFFPFLLSNIMTWKFDETSIGGDSLAETWGTISNLPLKDFPFCVSGVLVNQAQTLHTVEFGVSVGFYFSQKTVHLNPIAHAQEVWLTVREAMKLSVT